MLARVSVNAPTIFILMSFLLATRTVGVTVNTLGSADWQPSNRNTKLVQRVPSSDTISVMRPPPPPAQELRPRIHPRPPDPSVTSHSRHPVSQRPFILPAVSFSQFPSYQDDRIIHSNFAQFPQGTFKQNNSPEHLRQQFAFNQNVVDSTSRKPQQFGNPSDSSISESIVTKQLENFPHRQQLQFSSPVFHQGLKQQLTGSDTQNSLKLNQSRFVQNTIPSRNTWNQNGRDHENLSQIVENFGKLQHTATVPQASPSSEQKHALVNFPNNLNFRNLEPDVQFTQSIEASEHHSTYHAPPDEMLHSVQLPSAIRITNPPVLGPGTRSLSENQLGTTSAPDIKKKVTLKDILDEDCPKAKEMGYCASPPRYPSQQISQLITRCADLLKFMYAPVPEDLNDEYAGNTSTHSFNGTRNMERGNRHVRGKKLLLLEPI
ncbi:uncharacterized protein LOC110838499 isoform X2 [Zootermopsis nevadensis]|uniref:uncharacterized protein LOC110838499 isoform X2 n=1 Tax=Zootermopsis nevadensis TaxID=136037 RepID=UPI000B8EB243|nr:uncharacterized protein LOC110838499 isoform X2 [Zootermopsis nevadensis]